MRHVLDERAPLVVRRALGVGHCRPSSSGEVACRWCTHDGTQAGVAVRLGRDARRHSDDVGGGPPHLHAGGAGHLRRDPAVGDRWSISLLVYAPSWVHGPRYRPGQPWESNSEWFGTSVAADASPVAAGSRALDGRRPGRAQARRREDPTRYGARALALGARVPTGEAFTDAQRHEISRAVAEAERELGWAFAVEVGPSADDTRGYAEALHARLPDPTRQHPDPGGSRSPYPRDRHRRHWSAGRSSNRSAALVAVTMQSAFAGGDLTRGLVCRRPPAGPALPHPEGPPHRHPLTDRADRRPGRIVSRAGHGQGWASRRWAARARSRSDRPSST